MTDKQMVTRTLFIIFMLSWAGAAWSAIDIQSTETVHLEIKGYDGLTELTLFQGELAAGIQQHVATSYKGLALLLFAQGQSYPVILGTQPFLIQISDPDTRPSFSGSDENEYFYALLRGAETGNGQYKFPELMIKGKQLLDSTGSIHTTDDLQAMKEKFHFFVRVNLSDLNHSDMLRRLIAQYFMMHEYVDFHIPGAPATDIRVRYQQAVMEGVDKWLEVLSPDIPRNEILNYCVSLYYDRSMVSLAAKIMENFADIALCPGKQQPLPVLSPELRLIDASGIKQTLQDVPGQKWISFVSDDCPVSKVAAIVNARRLDRQNAATMIVVTLQPLSEKHLAMQRMVSGGRMMFVDDEIWRKENIPQGMKLPRVLQIAD